MAVSATSRRTSKNQRRGLAAGTRVYDYLKSQLLEGAFHNVARLPVEDIAAELEVSRQPVMDSIKRLTVEGFLEIIPQVGSRVRRHETRDVQDFFHLFALSEAYLARLAAERAEMEDIVNLRLISAQIGALTRLRKSTLEIGKLYRILNRKFHYEIRIVARSNAVGELVETLRDRSDFFLMSDRGGGFAERVETAHAEHEAIIDAIEERDGSRAAEAMKTHILAVEGSLHDVTAASVSRNKALRRTKRRRMD